MKDKKYKRVKLKNFDGYSIDTDGQVWSDKRTVKRGNSTYEVAEKKLKKVVTQPLLYNRVWLYVNGKMYQPYVMTLMGQAFFDLDNVTDGKTEMNHKNCNRQDDSIGNLERMDRKENVQHSYDVCRKANTR